MLSPTAVEATFAAMRDTTTELVSKWTSSNQGLRIDVMEDLRRLNLEATVLSLFDQRLNCLSGPAPPVIKAIDDATFESMQRPNRPKFLTWLLYQSKWEKDIKTMRDFAASIIANRRSNPTSRKDMLQAILHAQDPETGTSLSEEQKIDEIVTLLIGPTTSPCLIAFTLYHLLQNPACLSNARHEISTVLGPSTPLSPVHLPQLAYCSAILKESLRLSPPAPGFNIEPLPPNTAAPQQPILLASGKHLIPPNQPIIALLWAINRDPAVFPDPLTFNPDRMLPEAYARLPAAAKKWFGNGKRACTGRHFAWQWAMTVLVGILREVDLTMDEEGYVLEVEGAYNLKPKGFWAVGRKREEEEGLGK
jgi:cytochrome P450